MPAKTISQLTQATTINNADEFAIEQSGVTKRVAASVVRGDIANANISASAAIAYSKLAPLNSAQILVGNGSNVATAVNVTGDVTISNAGVTAIAAGAVVTADLADSAVTSAKLAQPYTLATAQNSTSGTSIDFTGIPSWAKRITVMLNGVSTNGTSIVQLQIGTSAGFLTSGYSGAAMACLSGATNLVTNPTTGCHIAADGLAAYVRHGQIIISNLTGNTWSIAYNGSDSASARVFSAACTASLASTLDRVRITTVNGTDAFDAGSINIAYEG